MTKKATLEEMNRKALDTMLRDKELLYSRLSSMNLQRENIQAQLEQLEVGINYVNGLLQSANAENPQTVETPERSANI